ncbi:probable L-type lectin-domain containing receptor kinase S.5 [Amborella trichopoda]|uniref:probable L-type lectin-domain containing receptor kinase S.5 n=1 Tax=Amborella trichopoda TaxID=13333 RepID=UPI0009BE52EF|nr:probable L-type lectin-domain containing receptor kinase S.5 [Amborella trichopoda]|eukprot:XP_011626487.2 probable L-type lectin-domain containing receptor kinase S.5 [Amborella trichopoda]
MKIWKHKYFSFISCRATSASFMASRERKPIILSSSFLLLLLPTLAANPYSIWSQSFDSFNYSVISEFAFLHNATINQGVLLVTPDNFGNSLGEPYQSGRVMLKKPFRLWKNKSSSASSKTVASFNSTFVFNTFRLGRPESEGLAFMIALDFEIPTNSDGQWLGLTNSTLDTNPVNQFIAIEFDTAKQSFDPDDNHVGVVVNSVISIKTASLTPLGLNLTEENGASFIAWVEYDGSNRSIKVFVEKEAKGVKPETPVLSYDIDVSKYISETSYFGFSASTGESAELNCVLKWEISVDELPEGASWIKRGMVIGISCFFVLIFIGLLGIFIHRRRKRFVKIEERSFKSTLKRLPGMPREFGFGELKEATGGFAEELKLGQGGFGSVYRGVLKREGEQEMVMAVKKFSREATQGRNDFLAELSVINRLRHKNLVKLQGWGHRKGMLLLVYDCMPNGSLDKHLHGHGSCLSWDQRYKILSNVASALHYLHDEYDHKVLHRDLKASNIMLDSDFNARLGDFGLARILDQEKTSYVEANGVPDTLGYIAPECFSTGKATRESDVFGFGAVILEVVCGRRPCHTTLVDHVWALYREGRVLEVVDHRLHGKYDQDDARRLLHLGLACSHTKPTERPRTETIAQVIARSVPPPYVPPFRPLLELDAGSSTATSTNGSLSTTHQISREHHSTKVRT